MINWQIFIVLALTLCTELLLIHSVLGQYVLLHQFPEFPIYLNKMPLIKQRSLSCSLVVYRLLKLNNKLRLIYYLITWKMATPMPPTSESHVYKILNRNHGRFLLSPKSMRQRVNISILKTLTWLWNKSRHQSWIGC